MNIDNSLINPLCTSLNLQLCQSSNNLRNDTVDPSSNLKVLRGVLGDRSAALSKLQVAQLDNDVAKLLNNIGCFLYLEHRKTSAVTKFCQSLNVLIHLSDPKIAACEETEALELSVVAFSLRLALIHLFSKNKEGSKASEFTRNVAVVLSNMLKSILKKKYKEGDKKSYKVDHGCDIKTACVLTKTNAEVHVWLGRYHDAIANYEVLGTLLEQRLLLNKGHCAAEVEIEEETVAVLLKMRLIYADVLSDSEAAAGCLRRVADHRKRALELKLELGKQQQLLSSEVEMVKR